MENRFCKKCLLDKVMGDAEYKHMQDYIKNIDNDIKTPVIKNANIFLTFFDFIISFPLYIL